MFLFGSKKPRPQHHLVVSIEAACVRVCFMLHEDTQKPYMVAQHAQFIQGDTTDMSRVSMSINKALHALIQTYPCKVDSVLCVLGSSMSQIYTKNYVRDEEAPFLFRERDVKMILKDTLHDIEKNQLDREGYIHIEKHILHIGLNGYEVDSVRRDSVRRAELSMYFSFVSSHVVRAIQHEIERHVKKTITFHTAPFVEAVVLRDAFPYLDSYVITHVEEAHTSITTVSDNVLSFHNSFSAGTEILKREIVNIGFSLELIESEMRLAHTNNLELGSQQKIHSLVRKISELWRKKLHDSLVPSLAQVPLPNTVLMLTDPTSYVWLKQAVEDARNKHLSVSDTPLHAILVQTETLHDLVGSKIANPDTSLLVYGAFIVVRR